MSVSAYNQVGQSARFASRTRQKRRVLCSGQFAATAPLSPRLCPRRYVAIFFSMILLCSLANPTLTRAMEVSIATEQVSSQEFSITLKSQEILEAPTAQTLLSGAAIVACSGQLPTFGRHRFEGREILSGPDSSDEKPSFVFIQEIFCDDPKSQPAENIPILDDAARAALSRKAQTLTSEFFSHLDDRNYEDAYQLISPGALGEDKNTWIEAQSNLTEKIGKRLSTKILRTTLYENPENAPEPGNYIAIDYESMHEDGALSCGYHVWFQGANGEVKLSRTEFGFIESSALAKMSAEEISSAKNRFNCVAT